MIRILTDHEPINSAEKRATRILTEISCQETNYKWTIKE